MAPRAVIGIGDHCHQDEKTWDKARYWNREAEQRQPSGGQMCPITVINRLFGFRSSTTAQLEQETAKASVRFVIFLLMPELLNGTEP